MFRRRSGQLQRSFSTRHSFPEFFHIVRYCKELRHVLIHSAKLSTSFGGAAPENKWYLHRVRLREFRSQAGSSLPANYQIQVRLGSRGSLRFETWKTWRETQTSRDQNSVGCVVSGHSGRHGVCFIDLMGKIPLRLRFARSARQCFRLLDTGIDYFYCHACVWRREPQGRELSYDVAG